ncbi:hypothetical protein BD770DRAFT_458100 [Pilaira anomala]|nr:hypothetical protein BD770DRAFT_458100 [Pilaira anomala]
MVAISSPRRFAPLMAQNSFKMNIIGPTARAVKAIPVIRPQDLATKGDGTLFYKKDDNLLNLHGTYTHFMQQVGPRYLIVLSKTIKVEVMEVVSDTQLKLKTQLNEEAIQHLLHEDDTKYKVIPHVDQSFSMKRRMSALIRVNVYYDISGRRRSR